MSIEVMKQALEVAEMAADSITNEVNHYIATYGTKWRPHRLQALYDDLAKANDTISALRTAIEPAEKQEPVNRYCCHACFTTSGCILLDRMILCPQCGNKRCPKASNHLLTCTGSNEAGQAGSVYATPPAAPVQKPPVFAELLCVCGAEWAWRNRDWELVATPPAAQRQYPLPDDMYDSLDAARPDHFASAGKLMQRQPLTDEQIRDLWSWSATAEAERTANTQQHAFARAIEAAHGIGGKA